MVPPIETCRDITLLARGRLVWGGIPAHLLDGRSEGLLGDEVSLDELLHGQIEELGDTIDVLLLRQSLSEIREDSKVVHEDLVARLMLGIGAVVLIMRPAKLRESMAIGGGGP